MGRVAVGEENRLQFRHGLADRGDVRLDQRPRIEHRSLAKEIRPRTVERERTGIRGGDRANVHRSTIWGGELKVRRAAVKRMLVYRAIVTTIIVPNASRRPVRGHRAISSAAGKASIGSKKSQTRAVSTCSSPVTATMTGTTVAEAATAVASERSRRMRKSIAPITAAHPAPTPKSTRSNTILNR